MRIDRGYTMWSLLITGSNTIQIQTPHVHIILLLVLLQACWYTFSGPTWIGPGGSVTCTVLEECVTYRGRSFRRKEWAAITVTTMYRLMQGSRSQSYIPRDDNDSLPLPPRGTG